MKRFSAILIAIMLACVTLSAAYAMPTEHAVSYMFVKTGNGGPLNLRAEQSVHSDQLASIPYGTQVMLYDMQPGDTWVWCVYNDKEGYVMTRYLSDSQPSMQVTVKGSESGEYKKMEAAYYYATVAPGTPSGFVHMRWAPSKSEPIMRDYYASQTLTVLWQDKNWCQVYDAENNICGYMMRRFLTYAGPIVSSDGTVQ